MTAPRRKPPSRFIQVLIGVTFLAHLVFTLAAVELMRVLGVGSAVLGGVLLSAALFACFLRRLQKLFPDRPRSSSTLHLVEEPYFAHWSATIGALLPTLLYTLIKAVVSAAQGAFALPSTFALVAYLLALALATFGVFVRRRWVITRRLELRIPGLPPAFDGYRIAQLSDLHIGGFTPRSWGEAWARRSNATTPDLVVVTGDMVSSGTAFHQDIAAVIGQLTAKDGVLVSMGNHDYFGDGEPLISLLRATGAKVLRNEGTLVRRGESHLFVAGVDDTWTKRANMKQALSARPDDACSVLLAHDPDLFAEAASYGVSLVLSGHTHGGQIALPFFARQVSLARIAHRQFLGIYRQGRSTLYVHPGLGTTGPPIRLGAAPEVALLTLRCA